MSESILKFMISCMKESEKKVQTDQYCYAYQQGYHLWCQNSFKYQTVHERILRAKDCQFCKHTIQLWSNCFEKEKLWSYWIYDDTQTIAKLYSDSEWNQFCCSVLQSNDSNSWRLNFHCLLHVSRQHCCERTLNRLWWQRDLDRSTSLCTEINTESEQDFSQCWVCRRMCFQWKVTVYHEKAKNYEVHMWIWRTFSQDSKSTKDCEVIIMSKHKRCSDIYWTLCILLTMNKEVCHDCDLNIWLVQKESYFWLENRRTESHELSQDCALNSVNYMISDLWWWCRQDHTDSKLKSKELKFLFNASCKESTTLTCL